ncbi:putative DNA-binding protein [Actinokineospora spheciospongiae]|uniref:Putative DNA-binding protein n=1 Tax=Actinokineospora spheciospongiae TaxID=909613 RepID=W7ICW9_9PSEU|nr:helix-turn-helix transcriptional regulator [Actinokineospora spheciospongiae]EWC58625.1 putative DNA-binding protein [Actinokineospora spheciospongiae]
MPPGRPTIRSRQVAGELRRLRKQAGMTTGEVGARLGLSQAKVSRVETGSSGLRLPDVEAMLGLYRVPAPRRVEILDLVRQAAEPGWVQVHGRGLPEQWQTLVDWESKASRLRNHQPLIIPGLLQTPDFARAVVRGTAPAPLSAAELDGKVAARLARQAILSRESPPVLHVVLGEWALRVPVGGPHVHHGQLRHLLEMSRRPRVVLQVVPSDTEAHPGLEGSFVLMDFPADPAMAYTEHRARSVFLDEPEDVEVFRLAWQRILAHAWSPERSTAFLAELAGLPT